MQLFNRKLVKPVPADLQAEYRNHNRERFLPYLRAVLFLFFLAAVGISLYFYLNSNAYTPYNVYNVFTAFHFICLFLSVLPGMKRISIVLASATIVANTFLMGAVSGLLPISFEVFWVSFLIPFVFIPLIPSVVAAFSTLWLSSYIILHLAKISDLHESEVSHVAYTIVYFGIIIMALSYIMEVYRQNAFMMEKHLKDAKDEADRANEAKSQFLATMSHEVRTPLNGILGLITLLRDTDLDTAQKNYTETIKYSGESLLTIVNDILDISKIEAGKFDLEYISFSPERLVRSVYDLMGSRVKEKGLRFTCFTDQNMPPYLLSDPTRIRQVLLNLVGNAVKFTDEGRVEIKMSFTPSPSDNQKGTLTLAVRDTGTGISEDGKKKLFQEFSQTDSSISRKYGGTGLGLSICQNIAEMMKGRIKVESTEGEGSCFTLSLPVEVAESDEEVNHAQAVKSKETDHAPMHILVVEDNAVNQKVISGLLERCDHKVILKNNGREAVDFLEAEHNLDLDIVLMDMQMPIMGGLEATGCIRASSNKHKDIPIIALTANSSGEDEAKCFSAGMSGYLSKPIDPETLYKVINDCRITDGYTEEQTRAKNKPDAKDAGTKNIRQLEDMMGKSYVQNLKGEAVVEMQNLVNAMKQADNTNEVLCAAHDLGNHAKMFGLTDIEIITKHLEMVCDNGNTESIKDTIELLEKKYQEARRHMTAARGEGAIQAQTH